MCALLDANAVGDVLAADRSAAAHAFFNWITRGRGKVYTTLHGGEYTKSHNRLLGNRSLCARGNR